MSIYFVLVYTRSTVRSILNNYLDNGGLNVYKYIRVYLLLNWGLGYWTNKNSKENNTTVPLITNHLKTDKLQLDEFKMHLQIMIHPLVYIIFQTVLGVPQTFSKMKSGYICKRTRRAWFCRVKFLCQTYIKWELIKYKILEIPNFR